MQLVKDSLVPRAPTPVFVIPLVRLRIDYLARTMNTLRLEARCGVGNKLPVVDSELIACACVRVRRREFEPALAGARHGKIDAAIIQKQVDLSRLRSPQSKANAFPQTFSAERHVMRALHAAEARLRSILRTRLGSRSTSSASDLACNGYFAAAG